MQKTLMKIINELMKMKDDEKFCKAEYDAVQDYCYCRLEKTCYIGGKCYEDYTKRN